MGGLNDPIKKFFYKIAPRGGPEGVFRGFLNPSQKTPILDHFYRFFDSFLCFPEKSQISAIFTIFTGFIEKVTTFHKMLAFSENYNTSIKLMFFINLQTPEKLSIFA